MNLMLRYGSFTGVVLAIDAPFIHATTTTISSFIEDAWLSVVNAFLIFLSIVQRTMAILSIISILARFIFIRTIIGD